MILKNYFKGQLLLVALFFAAFSMMTPTQVLAQCPDTNNQFGTSAAPTTAGLATTLTTSIWGGEYRLVTGLVAGETYRFETCGDTDFDTQITVYTDGGGAFIAYNDDFCGLQSLVEFVAPSSGSYRVLINQYFCGSINTSMTLVATLINTSPPANDDACNAELLTIGVSSTVDNAYATVEANERSPGAGTGGSSCNSQDGWCSFELGLDNTVWYKFVAPASGCVTISSLTSDLQMAVWTTDYCALFPFYKLAAANDDSGPGFAPLVENLSVNPGATYYVQIDGYNGATTTTDVILVEDGAGPIGAPWTTTHIGAAVGSFGYVSCGDEFTMSSNQFSTPFKDQGGYVLQTLCGDGYVQARVSDVDGFGWAGIVMRESTAQGSKKVALKSQLSTLLRRDVRKSTNGFGQSQQYPRPTGWDWVRLERVGNQFSGYVSSNGTDWQFVMSYTMLMNNCIEVGMFVESINVNAVTTAVFSSPEIGACPCNSSFNPLVQAESGIETAQGENNVSKLAVYPMPSTGLVNIEVGDFIDKAVQASIYNNLGQEVWSQKFESLETSTITADLNVPNGTYTLRFLSDGQQVTKQIVITK